MWKTPDYFAGKTILLIGAASGTALATPLPACGEEQKIKPVNYRAS
jgi:hypothetical protein